MVATKTALLALAAIGAQEVAAFNSHRHLHERQQLDRRALKVDYATVWKTITITGGAPVPQQTTTKVIKKPVATTTIQLSSVQAVAADSLSTDAEIGLDADGNVVVGAPVPASATATAATTLITAVLPPVVTDAPVESTYDTPPPPAPTTTAGSSDLPFSRKRGLAYNDVSLANAFGSHSSNCGWGYNWGTSSGGLDSKLNYVPMLWSTDANHATGWDDYAENAIASGSKALFSFNEPDNAGQSNMSPSQAAASHAEFLNKYAGRALIGAPAVSNSGNPGEGIEWLTSFLQACDGQDGGCQVDFCNVHWYSEPQYSSTLFDHLEQAHEACGGKPIWLTEFAPLGTGSAVDDFMNDVIPKLESLDYLHAYSYFMVSADSLMSSSDTLSSFGQLYADLS